MDRTTVIELGRPEALVLSDFLHRLEDDDCWPEDPAEELALWRLAGALEKTLTEPLLPDYSQLLDEARSMLLRQAGAGPDALGEDGHSK